MSEITDGSIRQEIKTRMREAEGMAEYFRREMQEEMSSLLERKIILGASRDLATRWRYLNCQGWKIQHRFSMREICQVLIHIHRLKDPPSFRKTKLDSHGLGVSTEVLFGPGTRTRFAEVVEELFPGNEETKANEIRQSMLSRYIDLTPLPDNPFQLMPEYKRRLKTLRTKEGELKQKYSRPFRGNPWR